MENVKLLENVKLVSMGTHLALQENVSKSKNAQQISTSTMENALTAWQVARNALKPTHAKNATHLSSKTMTKCVNPAQTTVMSVLHLQNALSVRVNSDSMISLNAFSFVEKENITKMEHVMNAWIIVKNVMILRHALNAQSILNSTNHKRSVLAVQRTVRLVRQVNVKSVLTGSRPKMEYANHAQLELISIRKTELAMTACQTAVHARARTFAINAKKDTTSLMELASNAPGSARNAIIKESVKNVILPLSLLKGNVSRLVKITNM